MLLQEHGHKKESTGTPPPAEPFPNKGLWFKPYSYIHVTNLAGLPTNNKTLAFWIKRKVHESTFVAMAIGQTIVAKMFDVYVAGGNYVNIHYYGNGAAELSSQSDELPLGEKLFVAFTWDNSGTTSIGTTYRGFFNSVSGQYEVYLDATYDYGGLITTDTSNNAMMIGGGFYGPNNINAVLSEIQVWDTVRTPAQMLADMQGIANPSSQVNLKAYFKLDNGRTVTENSGKSCTVTFMETEPGVITDYTF